MAVGGMCFAMSYHLLQIILGQLLFGAALTLFTLSMSEYARGNVAPSMRGRALSLTGGCRRLGFLIGPLIGA